MKNKYSWGDILIWNYNGEKIRCVVVNDSHEDYIFAETLDGAERSLYIDESSEKEFTLSNDSGVIL